MNNNIRLSFIKNVFYVVGIFYLQSSLAQNLTESKLKDSPTPIASCHGQMFTQVLANLCFDCFFPITIGSDTVEDGSLPDTDNPDNPICECGSFPDIHVGFAVGYWEPMALIDVTRTPYCMVNLGGTKLSNAPSKEGDVDTSSSDQHSGFYHVHYYNFPIIGMIFGDLLGGSCISDGDVSIPYLSELDPTWNNEQVSNTFFPETQIYANPEIAVPAQIACGVDSLKDNTGLPADLTFFCAGSQGFMYPLTGKVAEDNGIDQASSLMAERVMFKLHRVFWIKDTSKDELCEEHHDILMKKSRYRYQMIYPTRQACEPFGRSTMLGGFNPGFANLASGDDVGYLIWRKRNCCNF